ncbi:MAG: hypothetical protein P8J24_06160 [Arenicellales bacterium]|nr:hypothetical protein [Arenicellales bacterium]
MKTKTYLALCAIASMLWVITLLAVPGLSDTVEQYVLFFLSTNAR